MVASCQAITSASAGKIGRMYDDSFDPDRLKNTNMNAAQTSTKRCQQKPLRSGRASVHDRFAVHANSVSHGRMPTAKIGTKYHHGASRLASLVRKRVKCS